MISIAIIKVLVGYAANRADLTCVILCCTEAPLNYISIYLFVPILMCKILFYLFIYLFNFLSQLLYNHVFPGYMIISYLVREQSVSVEAAFELFKTQRQPGVYSLKTLSLT